VMRVRGGQAGGLPLFLVLGSMTLVGPAAMDIYFPGLPALARDLHATPAAAQLTVTTFLFGIAIGQFLSGPLSDIHGRRRPMLSALGVFGTVSIACSFLPNVYLLASARLFQGIVAAAGMGIGRAIVRDLFAGAAAARYLSRLMLITGLGPIVAPVVGGQLLGVVSWRGLFVVVGLFGFALLLTGFRWLPETLPRDRRRGGGIGETARAFASLLADRRFLGFAGVSGFAGGAVLAYVTGSSFVLQDVYGASPQLYSAVLAVSACCLVAGAQVNAQLVHRLSPQRLLTFGLVVLLVGALLALVVVFVGGGGIALISLPMMIVATSWGLIAANALALALEDKPHVAGTASAVLGVSQGISGALIAPLLGVAGATATPMAVAMTVCAIASCLCYRVLVGPSRLELVSISEAPTG
jgi:DHA1 family bicyclomycin/chloramphenicol resistance-like MFS transporter